MSKIAKFGLGRRKWRDLQKRAGERGIVWNLSYEDYMNWWKQHGVDKDKPHVYNKQTLVMCRHNDTGAYEIGNIYCATMEKNCKDSFRFGFNSWTNKKDRRAHNRKKVHTDIGIFESVKEASKSLKISENALRRRINHPDKIQFYFL